MNVCSLLVSPRWRQHLRQFFFLLVHGTLTWPVAIERIGLVLLGRNTGSLCFGEYQLNPLFLQLVLFIHFWELYLLHNFVSCHYLQIWFNGYMLHWISLRTHCSQWISPSFYLIFPGKSSPTPQSPAALHASVSLRTCCDGTPPLRPGFDRVFSRFFFVESMPYPITSEDEIGRNDDKKEL